MYGYWRAKVQPGLPAQPDPESKFLRILPKFAPYVRRHHAEKGAPEQLFRRIADSVAAGGEKWSSDARYRTWVNAFGTMSAEKIEKRIAEAFAPASVATGPAYRSADEVFADQEASWGKKPERERTSA